MSRFDILILISALAVVAGVAVPQQGEMAREERRSQVLALARGAASASELAHTRWLAAGEPSTLQGQRGLVAMSDGYPSRATLPLLFDEAELAPFAYAGGAWQHREVSTGRYCGVIYTPPAAGAGKASIVTRIDGC